MSLDSELLNRQEQEEAAGELRKKGPKEDRQTSDPSLDKKGTSDPSLDKKQSLRAQVASIKKASVGQDGSISTAPSAKLLKAAWMNLLSSYGATLLWINIHAFLSITVGKGFFCKLGEEWLPINAKKSTNERAQKLAKALSFLETLALVLLDTLIILIVIVILGIIIMIIDAIIPSVFGETQGNVFPAWN